MRNWFLRNRAFLVYIPLIVSAIYWLLMRAEIGPGLMVLLLFAGLLSWTFLEWMLHRAMHLNTGIKWIARIQDTAHLRHHREPDDLEHSVVRLSASLPLSLLILAALRLALGDWSWALATLCGVLIGYLTYEFVHLCSHGRNNPHLLRYVQRYHLRHHFERMDRGFGVTTPLWDWLFGTLPPARNAHAPSG